MITKKNPFMNVIFKSIDCVWFRDAIRNVWNPELFKTDQGPWKSVASGFQNQSCEGKQCS